MWRRAAFSVGCSRSYRSLSTAPRSPVLVLASTRGTSSSSSSSTSSSRNTNRSRTVEGASDYYKERSKSSSGDRFTKSGSSSSRGRGSFAGSRQPREPREDEAPPSYRDGSSSSSRDRSSSSSSSSRDRSSNSSRDRSSNTSRDNGSSRGSKAYSRSKDESFDSSPGPPPPRARDILLKPNRAPAAAAAAGTSSAAAAAEGEGRVRQGDSWAGSSAPAVSPDLGSSVDSPTFVPRDPKVKDGPWSDVDKQLVIAAQHDAEQQAQASLTLPPLQPSPNDPTQQQQQQQQQQQGEGLGPADLKGFVLLGKTPEQLSALAVQFGQAKYRGKQVLDSMLLGCRDVLELGAVPKAFREALVEAGVVTGRSVVHHSVKAPDSTQKLLLQLAEGRVVETVGIPVTDERGKQRLTVCVSSQVGCPMRCTFCATGKGGFARNLQAHEIIDQVLTVAEAFGQRPTNVVFMGMGEPLLNIPAVVAAATYMKEQMGMSGRAITISTVGVPNAIRKLADHQLTATLAVSIHAPNQELREKLIPSAKIYPISRLMADCRDYFRLTGRRVTFEYTLMGGTNDQAEHAQELASLLRHYNLMSHVNLIPWNPVDDSPYKRPGSSKVSAFRSVLEGAGIPVSVRTTRGLEAAAACGQLRNSFQKQQLQDPQPLR